MNLRWNEIGPQGAQYLANALENNQVGSTRKLYINRYVLFLQTLRNLDLEGNSIGSIGTEYISNTLHNNQVRSTLYSSIFYHFL